VKERESESEKMGHLDGDHRKAKAAFRVLGLGGGEFRVSGVDTSTGKRESSLLTTYWS
jgi:hypothetical protein